MVKYPEELIQMIWKCRLYARVDMTCMKGESVQVIDPGIHNRDAGPDFLQAKLRIREILWVGNVELHWQAKSWFAHQHHQDQRYDNVILHVVWEGELDVIRRDGSIIPTLQLKQYVSPDLLMRYQHIIQSKTWIPCANHLKAIPDHIKFQVLDRMIKSRLESRKAYIDGLLVRCTNDWERVTRVLFAEAFGMRVNKQPFSRLIDSIPNNILDRYKGKADTISALLYGQAGFLNGSDISDTYYSNLKTTYHYLQQLHKLIPMKEQEWFFLRMRPANFPSLRIAQLSAVFVEMSRLCHLIISTPDLRALQSDFSKLLPSDYWSVHYHFGKATKKKQVRFTASFLDHMAINCFVPILYAYGYHHGIEEMQQRALAWLSTLSPERNSLVKKFEESGFAVHGAADTQGLLELYRTHCERKLCISCAIGFHLLGRDNS